MAVASHIVLLLASLLMTAGCMIVYGGLPTVRHAIVGFGLGLLLAFLLIICTTVASAEGNSSLLPLLLWGCVWISAATIPSVKKVASMSGALFVLFIVLGFQHVALAT